jgi:hypothetical protein
MNGKTTTLWSYGLLPFQKAKIHSAELKKVHLWIKGFMHSNKINCESAAHLSPLVRFCFVSRVRSAYIKRRTISCSAGTIYSSSPISQAPFAYAVEQRNQCTKVTPLTSQIKLLSQPHYLIHFVSHMFWLLCHYEGDLYGTLTCHT